MKNFFRITLFYNNLSLFLLLAVLSFSSCATNLENPCDDIYKLAFADLMNEHLYGIPSFNIKGNEYEEIFLVGNRDDEASFNKRFYSSERDSFILGCSDPSLFINNEYCGVKITEYEGDEKRFPHREGIIFVICSNIYISGNSYFVDIIWSVTSRACGGYIYKLKKENGHYVIIKKYTSMIC